MPGWALIEVEDKKMIGGLELPESAKTETQRGTIVVLPAEASYFVESGVLVDIPPVSVGDKVSFRKYHSSEVEDDSGKKYAAVHFENIIVKHN